MLRISVLITWLFFSGAALWGQDLHIQSYGSPEDIPVVFLHGGPGYNAAGFEGSTAATLAESGFYVITYDRRGEGRSLDKSAAFTFDQSTKDLSKILKKHSIKKAILLGHSFGGMVATKFATKYPEKVQALVLVGAPMDLQASFAHIIQTCKGIYTAKNDSVNLNYISMLENMDKASLPYATYSFSHAMSNGFYSPKTPTEEAQVVYARFSEDKEAVKLSMTMTERPTRNFWKNESYTTVNLSSELKAIKGAGVPIWGFYGQEDGLYSIEQIDDLRQIIGEDNLYYYEDCSHNVFMDQQSTFIRDLLQKAQSAK